MAPMSRRRIIALAAGAVVTILAFAAMMWLLVFTEYPAEKDRIVMVSIALGPVLMVSVMIGYCVWWGVLFLLTLFLPEERPQHPEFGSRPGRPHPLFRDFVGIAKDILREGAQPPLPLAT